MLHLLVNGYCRYVYVKICSCILYKIVALVILGKARSPMLIGGANVGLDYFYSLLEIDSSA